MSPTALFFVMLDVFTLQNINKNETLEVIYCKMGPLFVATMEIPSKSLLKVKAVFSIKCISSNIDYEKISPVTLPLYYIFGKLSR